VVERHVAREPGRVEWWDVGHGGWRRGKAAFKRLDEHPFGVNRFRHSKEPLGRRPSTCRRGVRGG
jgi:hypothetical protein